MSADIEDVRKAWKAEDYRTAMELARPLSDAGDMRARYAIGLMLVSGQGVSADTKQGLRLIEQAAEAGVAEAQAMMATAILSRMLPTKNLTEAVSWAEKAAAQNADAGHYILSVIYLNGFGVHQAPSLGIDHLRRAASNGNALAKYELGKALWVGRGTERNEVQGATMLKEAAAIEAQFSEEVELLLTKADQLRQLQKGELLLTCASFSCAGASGWSSKRLRAYMDKYMWAELAAKVLDIGDLTDLNYFYLGRALEGLGNLSAAKVYYKIALDPKRRGRVCAGLVNNCAGSVFPRDINERLASVDAAERYANLQLERQKAELIELERVKAKEAAEAAKAQILAEREQALSILSTKASQGNHNAQYQLAGYYFEGGGGVAADATLGINWLTKAAEGGLAEAQFDLGQRLLTGNDINVDERRAETFLRKAEAQGHQKATAAIVELMRVRQEEALRAQKARQAKELALAATAQKAKAEEVEAARKANADEAEAARKRRIENLEKLRNL
jgi:TPR repeat protein